MKLKHIFKLIYSLMILTMLSGALPSKSLSDLQATADVILTGLVQAEYDRIVSVEGREMMQRREIILQVRVARVLKGSGARQGEVVYLHAWKLEKRPMARRGVTGPMGHRGLPITGQSGTFHVSRDRRGALNILEPNGGYPLGVGPRRVKRTSGVGEATQPQEIPLLD